MVNRASFKKKVHNINKKIKGNKVLIKVFLFFVPIAKYFYFKNERLLAKGKSVSNSNEKSILFFTSHKCASTLINNILEKITKEEGLVPIHFSNYLPGAGKDPSYQDAGFLKRAFKTKGYYYGAFRMLYGVPDLPEYRILLVLRDPRDVLTSHFFSTAYNHPVARKKTLDDREQAQKLDIDEYVVAKSDEFLQVYSEYCDKLLHLPNVLFLKYEDMITDFAPWLNKMAVHLNLDKQKDLLETIVNETSFKVQKENKHSFIRNIKSGDHKNKLKPETIDFLNKKYSRVLQQLGYDV